MTALSLNCYERSWNITNEFYGKKLVSKYFTIFKTFQNIKFEIAYEIAYYINVVNPAQIAHNPYEGKYYNG